MRLKIIFNNQKCDIVVTQKKTLSRNIYGYKDIKDEIKINKRKSFIKFTERVSML